MVKKYSELYRDARKALLPIDGPHQAGATARELLQFVSGKTPAQLLADGEKYADDRICEALEDCIRRMEQGEPLAYILGEWEFYGLKLFVTPDVLIPRDDTCALAEIAIHQALFLPEKPRILDLCTGSGCIGIALATRVKDAKVTLADLSREALAVARTNVALHHLTGRVSCVQADAMDDPPAFLGQFDMIVSNPPYIDSKDMEGLEVSVKDYEPHMALFGGEDGLDFYRSITEKYRQNLKPGGFLCYEFGEEQGDDVCDILAANGFTVRQRVKDFCGTERAVIAQYCVEE